MASVQGVQNDWLRAVAARRAAALGAYGTLVIASVIGASLYDSRLAVAVLVSGVAFARRRRGLAQRYRYATQGAAGELETARLLAVLPAGFTVINDLTFDGFNVDHVVVGPSGVWVVETKSHPGIVEEHVDGVWLEGRPMFRDPRRQARAGAVAVAELLRRETGTRRWVEALVCFPNATVTANRHPAEACVVSGGQLLSRLRLAPTRLARDERGRIAETLSRAKHDRTYPSARRRSSDR